MILNLISIFFNLGIFIILFLICYFFHKRILEQSQKINNLYELQHMSINVIQELTNKCTEQQYFPTNNTSFTVDKHDNNDIVSNNDTNNKTFYLNNKIQVSDDEQSNSDSETDSDSESYTTKSSSDSDTSYDDSSISSDNSDTEENSFELDNSNFKLNGDFMNTIPSEFYIYDLKLINHDGDEGEDDDLQTSDKVEIISDNLKEENTSLLDEPETSFENIYSTPNESNIDDIIQMNFEEEQEEKTDKIEKTEKNKDIQSHPENDLKETKTEPLKDDEDNSVLMPKEELNNKPNQLESMPLKHLKAIARERNIDISKKITKPELIALLSAH